MAIDLISENNNPSSLPTSPRISFSYDLCPKDTSLSSIEQHPSHSSHHQLPNSDFNFSTTPNPSSSADELFSGGLIRPIPLLSSKPPPPSSSLPPPSKPLWHIRRSSSLHCENTHKKPPFCSSFPLLSRSFSTGSLAKGKKYNVETKKQRSSSSSSSATFYSFPSSPPRRNGEGVRISPVINILPHHVSANLFRFGSLFRNGKEKNKKLSLRNT